MELDPEKALAITEKIKELGLIGVLILLAFALGFIVYILYKKIGEVHSVHLETLASWRTSDGQMLVVLKEVREALEEDKELSAQRARTWEALGRTIEGMARQNQVIDTRLVELVTETRAQQRILDRLGRG